MSITADTLKPAAQAFPSIALILGALGLGLWLPSALKPAALSHWWRAFPRSAWPGWLLSAVAMVWAALWLTVMPLGPLMVVRQFLWILTPVSILAICVLVDELLSCRALGAILVLLPSVMLSSAQWHPSPWRYVMLVLAYVFALIGMVAIAQPFRLRDIILWFSKTPRRLRVTASANALLALLLVLIGLFCR